MEPPTQFSRAVIYAVTLTFACAVMWSYFANIVEVAAGTGQVVPENRLQVVQSLEGGVVTAIFARSGDRLKKGDIIVQLDPTSATGALAETRQQLAGLEAESIRLRAQLKALEWDSAADDQLARFNISSDAVSLVKSPPADKITIGQLSIHEPTFPLLLREEFPDFVHHNLEQFRTSFQELEKSLSSFDQQIAQRIIERAEMEARLAGTVNALHSAGEELAIFDKLLRTGAAGKAEVMNSRTRYNDLKSEETQLKLSLPRLAAAVAELQDRRAEKLNNFRNRTAELLTKTEVNLGALKATLGALAQRAARTEIRAPADGILKIVNASTMGQVFKPGENVAEIVPSDGAQLIQVRIRSEDIAFLRSGMPAIIKFTAYDYSIFGSLPGTLKRIPVDSTTDERGNVFYLVDVQAAANFIEYGGERWPIMAGMVANVDIVTGKRTIFQYVTKPIHRMATMALRER